MPPAYGKMLTSEQMLFTMAMKNHAHEAEVSVTGMHGPALLDLVPSLKPKISGAELADGRFHLRHFDHGDYATSSGT